jgi:hypothetical protein
MQTITGNNKINISASSSSSSSNTPTMSFLPKDYTPDETDDILCGRGNVYSSRPGNQYFQRIIQDNRSRYQEASTRPAKIKVVDDILKDIHRRGVKFTKMSNNNNRWCELDNVAAHQKIGHAIRDTIRLNERENNYNKSISISSSSISNRFNKSSVAIKKQKMMKKIHQKKRISIRVVRTSLDSQQKNQWLSSGEDDSSTTAMDEILGKSLETIFGIEQELNQQQQKQHRRASSIIEITTSSSTKSSRFLLTNEYPDTHFNFTASAFFGGDEKEENDDDEHTSSMFYEHDNDGDHSYTISNEIISLSSQ